MSTFSAVVNGQLVPVAPANAVVAPPAPQPMISSGAYASNMPGLNIMGGATNIPVPQTNAATNNSAVAPAGAATIAGFSGNVWSLPLWQNPLFYTMAMLAVAYLILRYIHWQH